MSIDNVALFDMDGTLCDYDGQILKDLERLRGDEEPHFVGPIRKGPDHIKARVDAITATSEWWKNLPKLELGWEILKIAQEQGYRIMILSQAPIDNPEAWSGKIKWLQKHLPDVDMTLTRDKGLVYGKLLVDDYPEYILRWLTWRRNGLVIMPSNDSNSGFEHKQVIRYDGSNIEEIKQAMTRLKEASGLEQMARDMPKSAKRVFNR